MSYIRNLISRTCDFFRGTLHVVGTLIGIKWTGEWGAQGLVIAGWTFLIGIPVGMLLLGPTTFSLAGWLFTVLTVLMITNMDDALIMMSNYLTYGVDGEVTDPYEEEQC